MSKNEIRQWGSTQNDIKLFLEYLISKFTSYEYSINSRKGKIFLEIFAFWLYNCLS